MTVMSFMKKVAGAVIPQKTILWDVPFQGIEGVPRILILSDHVNATYYATFHYTLQNLQARGVADFAVLSGEGVRRNLLNDEPREFVDRIVSQCLPHVVIFSRYATPRAEELLESFHTRHVLTLYYSDDNLLDVPESLGQGVVKQHGAAEVLEARRFCLANTSALLVSTSRLASVMRSKFPDKPIYQLLYPPYFGHLIERKPGEHRAPEGRPITIGYMGSRGHQRDLQMVVKAIARILDQFPWTRFETFGTIAMPDEFRRFGNRVAAHSPRNNYREFLQYLFELHWDIGLAPLEDTEFNRCRSTIKFLEYTACDVTTVASDRCVYRSVIGAESGLLTADGDWIAILEQVVTNQGLRSALLANAKTTCADRFPLQKVADDLARILTLAPSV